MLGGVQEAEDVAQEAFVRRAAVATAPDDERRRIRAGDGLTAGG
jgi:DNA-directed RNA polymerase specialized sigma24 family protein